MNKKLFENKKKFVELSIHPGAGIFKGRALHEKIPYIEKLSFLLCQMHDLNSIRTLRD